jgi:hypothetical protein
MSGSTLEAKFSRTGEAIITFAIVIHHETT